MVLYFIQKVQKAKIGKHVILGKTIYVRGTHAKEMKMCVQKLHPTLATLLAIKKQPKIESS